ncbi:hypothetical protein TSMEX_007956 [Taenia solium]|eukprot:TsM_000205100 transcript=TsM_000205100 gene=TsM_000205100
MRWRLAVLAFDCAMFECFTPFLCFGFIFIDLNGKRNFKLRESALRRS